MFSENERISVRQVRALLLIDWLGKTALLLPGFFRGISAEIMLPGIAGGLILGWGFLRITESAMRGMEKDYITDVGQRIGGWAVWALYLIYGIYFLYHTALLLYLCGQVAGTYLLPESSGAVLMLLPLLTGCYLADRGLEVRGRVCELLAGFLCLIFLLLLLLTVPEIHADLLWEGDGFRISDAASVSYFVMAGFGELGVIPFLYPSMISDEGSTEKAKAAGRAAGTALFLSGILLLLTFLECFGMFGREGMRRLEWPVVTLMSSVHLPGVFLQRWDILLIGLLLLAMFLSAGSGIYYLGLMARRSGMKKRPALLGVSLLSYGLAVYADGRGDPQVLYLYGRIAFLLCVPGMLLLTLLLVFRSRERAGTGRFAKRAEKGRSVS